MTRVLMVQTQAEGAGAQEISRLLAAGLTARGFEVHHLFFFRRTGAFDHEPRAIFCARERPRTPVALMRLLWRAFSAMRRVRPDAVLCFQHYGNLIGAPIAHAAGARRVIANRTSAAETMPRWARTADRLFGTLGLFSRIVVNSRSVAAEHHGDPAAYQRRLVRIEHGFEPKTSALSRQTARATLGLEAASTVLGCVARLHPLKNLDAAIRLLPHEPTWHFAVAGQGKELAALQALARELGCAERVHFLGELSAAQIGTFLRALDVFVFPSRAETFGLATVEAAAAGVPVVANDLDVLREVLAVDGEPCALFVDVSDTAALAGAVRRLLADAPLAAALSACGTRLRGRYALDAMVDSYAALIRDVASGKGAGAATRIGALPT